MNTEEELLNNKDKLSYMNNLLCENQFSENFLIKTRNYYDSWKCLKTQHNLSPYFCFYYLYDRQEFDSVDNWTDYNDIYNYLIKKNYTDEQIKQEFNITMKDRYKK